jgi:predicted O-methyltransferase YrrM
VIGPRHTIHEIYLQRCSVWSDIVDHLPVLRDTVVQAKAQTVVELGVRTGNSTAALLDGVELTGGHLWSVDIRLMPQAQYTPLKRAAGDRWTFVIGDDLAVADQLPEQIDVLFIDSSHFYEHTLAELALYGPRATTILLHDTELEHPDGAPPEPAFPVKRAVEKWCAEVGRPVEFLSNCYGLGIIR